MSVEPPRRSLRMPALIGSALGLLILGIGLFVVSRLPRSEGTRPTESAPSKPASTVPPAALAGLRYLPADTNIAFAMQPGPLLAQAERAKAGPNPQTDRGLTWAGLSDSATRLLQRFDLSFQQIDHVAGGLTLSRDRPLKVVLALVLREPLADRGAFLKKLKANQTTAANGQVRHTVLIDRLPMTMANPDPRTYLFAMDAADLDQPARTGPADAHLPTGLRESLGRLSPASFSWAATDSDDWSTNPGVKILAGLANRPDLPARLTGVRALAVAVSLEPEPRLTAAVRATDPDAAVKLQERMVNAATNREQVQFGSQGPWVTAEGPPAADAWAGLESLLPKPAGK